MYDIVITCGWSDKEFRKLLDKMFDVDPEAKIPEGLIGDIESEAEELLFDKGMECVLRIIDKKTNLRKRLKEYRKKRAVEDMRVFIESTIKT